MNNSRGVVLMIWGNKAYGFAAHNLVLSIKKTTPLLPVHLITDDSAIKGCYDLSLYDGITKLNKTPNDPALCKMQVYDKLPYDYNLFLDVDALCLQDLNKLFDDCIEDGREYRCAIHEWYDKSSPDKMPMMFWATRTVIWNHYNLTDEKLPATQSSIQFIKKSIFCKDLFSKIQDNYRNCIPLDNLLNRWGGGQPDELYLNITLAQLGYDPTLNDTIYFGDDMSKPFKEIKISYYILSMFGTAQNIKKRYVDAYNVTLKNIANELGQKHIEWKHIAGQKLANNKVNVMAKNNGWGRGAFQKRFFREAQAPKEAVIGSVHLYVGNMYNSMIPEREAELIECMRRNCENTTITKIFNWGNMPYDHPKVVNVETDKRPTYQDFIDAANKEGADYTILANSDLYYDDTLKWIDKVNLNKVMIALCRYDIVNGNPKLEAFSWSQGTWIFKGKIELTDVDYQLGVKGCDNAIAYDADHQGYKVLNPAKDIKCYHLHKSSFRTNTEKDRLKRSYLPVLITSILDIEKYQKVLIIQQGAVGDILIVMPIAEYYHKQGFIVEWLCPQKFHSMFDYIDFAKPVVKDSGNYKKVIDLSFGQDRNSRVHRLWVRRQAKIDSFVTFKYELAGVNLKNLRQLNYKRNEQKEAELFNIVVGDNTELYSLVHSNSTYGGTVEINTAYRKIDFKPIGDYTIFDWRKVIEGAKEIHCIDSSLLNFVDGLDVLAELYYYRIEERAKLGNQTIMTKKWMSPKLIDNVVSV